MRLALTPEQLTPEAQSALTAELATRGINGEANLDAARHEEEQRKLRMIESLEYLGSFSEFKLGSMCSIGKGVS